MCSTFFTCIKVAGSNLNTECQKKQMPSNIYDILAKKGFDKHTSEKTEIDVIFYINRIVPMLLLMLSDLIYL
jgi:hypothetical protein